MDEIKKELLHVFSETPQFSQNAKYEVLKRIRKKRTFRWRIPVVATAIAALSIIVFTQLNQIEPTKPNDSTTLQEVTNHPETAQITNELQYHITNESLSMDRGDAQYIGDVVIDPTITTFERNDVIYLEEAEGHYILARIVGLPGELVEIKDSQIYINGEPLNSEYGQAQVGGYTSYDEALQANQFDEQKLNEAFHVNMPVSRVQGHELFIVTDNWMNDAVQRVIQIDTDVIGVAIGMKDPTDAYIDSPMSQYPSTDGAEQFAKEVVSYFVAGNIDAIKNVLHSSASIQNNTITFHDDSKFDSLSFDESAVYTFAAYSPNQNSFEVGFRVENRNITYYLEIVEEGNKYTLRNIMIN